MLGNFSLFTKSLDLSSHKITSSKANYNSDVTRYIVDCVEPLCFYFSSVWKNEIPQKQTFTWKILALGISVSQEI